MVGYDPNKVNLSTVEQICVSFGTSVSSRVLIQPFDVIKIRFQVQYEPISKNSKISKYKNIHQTVSTIVKEEGFFALWKGHLTGQIFSFSYITAQFFWFELLTRLTYDIWPQRLTDSSNKPFFDFCCGGIAANLTLLTNHPLDTVRTRFVTQGEPRIYNSIQSAIVQIYTKEGIKGFYKGTLPAIFLVTPESAFRFGLYSFLNSKWTIWNDLLDSFKKKFIDTHVKKMPNKVNDIGMLQSTINGAVTGVIAKTIVYPFDLAKKRLQIQGFEDARKSFGKVTKFTGLFNCFYLTLKYEGFFGIYKGYYPSMIKAAVYSGLIFLFYEKFSNVFRKFKSKSS